MTLNKVLLYDVQKGGDEIRSLELTPTQKNRLDKIKNIGDFKGHEWTETLQHLLNNFWIESSKTHLKPLVNALHETRNIIKRTSKHLLEIMDDENFKFGSIVYLMILFHIENHYWRSKEGRNGTNNLVEFLKKTLTWTETIDISSFLCAHRERSVMKPDRKDYLAEKVNLVTFGRIQNAIKWFFNNVNIKFDLTFYQPGGDQYGMNSIFPTIFHNYLVQGKLNELLNWLNDHIAVLQNACKDENIHVESTFEYAQLIEKRLSEKYWPQRMNINAYSPSHVDKFSDVACYITREEMIRVLSSQRSLKLDDIDEYFKLNEFENLNNSQNSMIEQAITRYVQKWSVETKALYETMFYFLRWEMCQFNNKVWVWFDRDHSLFQSVSFALGYNGEVNQSAWIPLLYGRRKDVVNNKEIDKLSFRQFRHHDGMYK